MKLTVGILALTIALMVHGRIRADLAALGGLLALMLTGILTPQEALAGFSSPTLLTIAGLFIVGGAVFRTGLAAIISRKLMALAGTSETSLFIVIMLVTSCIGAFVSNSGTVAVMMPIVASLAAAAGVSQRRFLMPLAFASSMGGMFTLIGVLSNLIINGVLVDAGYESLHFFSFFPVGLACVSLGMLTLLPMSKWLLATKEDDEEKDGGQETSAADLAESYGLAGHLFRARVEAASPLAGKSLKELQLAAKYGCSVISISRDLAAGKLTGAPGPRNVPNPSTVFQPGDIAAFLGTPEAVRALAGQNGLDMRAVASDDPTWRHDTVGMSEVVLSSSSPLLNVPVKDSGFREKYFVTILGIRRHGRIILHNLREQSLQAGDCLLLQGQWRDIARLEKQHAEWGVATSLAAAVTKEPLEHKAPLAAAIVILMIAGMVLGVAPNFAIVLIAAMSLVFTGCFHSVPEAYGNIKWGIIILVAAMFPITTAVEKSGVILLISSTLTEVVGGMGPYALLAALYTATSITTLFITNAATSLIFAPIALRAAVDMQFSPYPFLMGVAVAASMCFASPFSTPANTMVMAPGRYVFMDYVRIGVPLQILYGIVMVLLLPLLFPF